VIVEVKSVELHAPVHKKRLPPYLRLADKRLGLLLNFQVALIREGITRIVNGPEDEAHAKSPSRQDAQRKLKRLRWDDGPTPGLAIVGPRRSSKIEGLRHMTVGQLKEKYHEVFGEASRSNHKQGGSVDLRLGG
jgi:PD-(D/E)XK nuclease superfamily